MAVKFNCILKLKKNNCTISNYYYNLTTWSHKCYVLVKSIVHKSSFNCEAGLPHTSAILSFAKNIFLIDCCNTFHSINMHGNAGDSCEQVLHFAALQSSNLVNSDLRIYIGYKKSWHDPLHEPLYMATTVNPTI